METKENIKIKTAAKNNSIDSNEIIDSKDLAIKTRFVLPPEVEILVPGLVLTASISAIALHAGSELTYVTPLILAMGLGILLRNAFIIPEAYKLGIFFSMRQLLRFAVALLGIRITFDKVAGLGWEGLVIALVPLTVTLILTMLIGKLLKMEQSPTLLIAAGTSICGAAAILTTAAVTKSKDEDAIVAISSITVFGTIAMLAYPLLLKAHLLPITDIQYGYLTGASIHEVAQVVTAAFGGGERSGEIGILVKLTRVSALIPIATLLSFLVSKGIYRFGKADEKASVAFPVFLLGFIAMVIFNSLGYFTPKAVKSIEFFDMFLLTMAMAGMGLETDFRQLMKVGFKPFFLSVFATATIAILSIILVINLIH
jgi:uncharacterized integral membrane protein (TIGR00698 family)